MEMIYCFLSISVVSSFFFLVAMTKQYQWCLLFLGPVVRIRLWVRWERNKGEEENWMSWRKEQSEAEVERRDSLMCDTVRPSVVSHGS